jgi:hypothetical protein
MNAAGERVLSRRATTRLTLHNPTGRVSSNFARFESQSFPVPSFEHPFGS